MSSILSTRFYFFIQFVLGLSVMLDLAVWYLNEFMVPSWVFAIFISASIMLIYAIRTLELKLEAPKKAKKKTVKVVKSNEQAF